MLCLPISSPCCASVFLAELGSRCSCPCHVSMSAVELDSAIATLTVVTRTSRVHPLLDLLLHGSVSCSSPLYKLRGQTSTLLRAIWHWYVSMSTHWDTTCTAYVRYDAMYQPLSMRPDKMDSVEFPQPKGNNNTPRTWACTVCLIQVTRFCC